MPDEKVNPSATGMQQAEPIAKVLLTVCSITAMIFTAGSMVTMWAFSAASLANNTSEESLHRVKLWVLNFSLLSIAGIAAGIWLLCRHRPGWSSLVSVLPAVAMGGTLLYLVVRG